MFHTPFHKVAPAFPQAGQIDPSVSDEGKPVASPRKPSLRLRLKSVSRALAPLAEAKIDWLSSADLDDEQPVQLTVTLGDIRRAMRASGLVESLAAKAV